MLLSKLAAFLFFVAAAHSAGNGTQWRGVPAGRFAVGFRWERSIDPTRTVAGGERGTPLGIAIWYPARTTAAAQPAMTQLEYRMLNFSQPLDPRAKAAFVDAEAGMMVAWRHVGIVPLTLDQARATLEARGYAVRDAARAPGKFPVVLILGGPWYLSTTAEILASRGYLVAAPVRFSDYASEVPSMNYTWSVEASVRDAEWALAGLDREQSADTAAVSALGHGGGGMQALVLAMRNRRVRAVANIDAGNFSARSNPAALPFYHPRLLRVPYLYVATAATQRDADQFRDFENMRFSRRYQVTLEDPELRHHDLSDAGHAVSATLGIRGPAQDAVLRHYADVQEMLARFLDAHGRGESADAGAAFAQWLPKAGLPGDYTVTIREAVQPAPDIQSVIRNPDQFPAERLAEIRRSDPEAPLFSEDALEQVIAAAGRLAPPALAVGLARFAVELHAGSLPLHEAAAAILASAGERAAAREVAERCSGMALPRNDWRAAAAQTACRKRLE